MTSCSRCCFFFQAEDGIRDLTVTGVQTCALPIFWARNAKFAMLPKEAEFAHPRGWPAKPNDAVGRRSEEHTSELQSQSNLVCRLLLEKKNAPQRPDEVSDRRRVPGAQSF